MLKLYLNFIYSFLIVSSLGHAQEFNINKVLSSKESDINVAEVSLLLAKEIYPNLDIKKYLIQLDSMASEIKLKTRGITDPDFRIRVVNTYLFKEKGYRYDLDDLMVSKADNSYLNGLLDTKKGSCITLPLLYIVLGQKLSYPIYPVLVPKHFFVRYVDAKLESQNIEATGGGGFTPDWMYQRDFNISKIGLKSGAYLKTLSFKEYLSELIALNASFHFREKKNYKKSFKYIDIAIKMRPITPEFYQQKGAMSYYLYKKYNQEGNKKLSKFYFAQADAMLKKSNKLGFVNLSDKEYLKSVEAQKTISKH